MALFFLSLSLFAGENYLLDSFAVYGNSTFDDYEIRRMTGLREGDWFDSLDISSAVEAVSRAYREIFPKGAGINYEIEEKTPPRALFILNIIEKDFVHSIEVSGNIVFSDRKILSVAGIKENGHFDPDKIPKLKDRIKEMYFKAGLEDAGVNIEWDGVTGIDIFIQIEEPEKEYEVKIEGASLFSERRINEHIGAIYRASPSKIRDYKRKIKNLYRSEGYLHAEVDASFSPGVMILRITEGRPLIFSSLFFRGPDKDEKEELLFNLDFSSGVRFTDQRVRSYAEKAAVFFESRGYAFVSVSLDTLILNENSGVDVFYSIEKNDRFVLGKPEIINDGITSEKVILREIRDMFGLYYSYSLVEKMKRRLSATGLFESVTISGPWLDTKNRILHPRLVIKEGLPNSFEGMVGYVPPDAGTEKQKGFFSGFIDLDLINIYGTARKFSLYYLREAGFTDFESEYTEPWVGGINADLSFILGITIDTSSYSRFLTGLGFKTPVVEDFELSGEVSRVDLTEYYQDSLPASTDSVKNSRKKIIYKTHVKTDLDKRNDPVNPSSGYRTSLRAGAAFSSGSSIPYKEISFGFTGGYLYEAFRRNIIFLRLMHDEIRSGQPVPLSEKIPYGGIATLRGYRESQFYQTNVIGLRSEYRYLISSASRFAVFIDAALFPDEAKGTGVSIFSSGLGKEFFKYGWGAGLRAGTEIGVLGIDYGVGRSNGPSEGMIHVRLENRF
ncbi:MAG: outer membrane protein assembly factor [Fibrobacterota bacterium]